MNGTSAIDNKKSQDDKSVTVKVSRCFGTNSCMPTNLLCFKVRFSTIILIFFTRFYFHLFYVIHRECSALL